MGGEQCQNVDILMACEVTVDTLLWCDFYASKFTGTHLMGENSIFKCHTEMSIHI